MSVCQVGDCSRPGVRNGPDGVTRMCWGHLRLARLGKPLRELGAPRGGKAGKWDRSHHLAEAAIDYADANASGNEEAFDRAWQRMKETSTAFVLGSYRGSRAARQALVRPAPKRKRPRGH